MALYEYFCDGLFISLLVLLKFLHIFFYNSIFSPFFSCYLHNGDLLLSRISLYYCDLYYYFYGVTFSAMFDAKRTGLVYVLYMHDANLYSVCHYSYDALLALHTSFYNDCFYIFNANVSNPEVGNIAITCVANFIGSFPSLYFFFRIHDVNLCLNSSFCVNIPCQLWYLMYGTASVVSYIYVTFFLRT